MGLLASGDLPGIEMIFGNAVMNSGYAHRDAIWGWLDSQPPGDHSTRIRGALLNAIGYREPEIALTFLEKIPDTPANASLFQLGISSLFNGGSRMDLFEGLYEKAPEKLRVRMLEMGFQDARKLIANDPALWIGRLGEIAPERRANSAAGLASAWATADPGAAVKWAASLPEEGGRDMAFRNIASTWASSDPHDAAQWVNTLPQGAGRDGATQSLVRALARSEPQAAWDWAMSIKSEDARLSSLEMAYLGLKKKNAESADEMLSNSNLRPELIQKLRDSYRPGLENRFFP